MDEPPLRDGAGGQRADEAGDVAGWEDHDGSLGRPIRDVRSR